MENNDCAQTTQPQDFNPVEAIHREIEQVSGSGLVGMLRIKTANQTILDAATRPNPKDLYHSLWYEGEVCCLFADSNLGKSIYAVQMADEIARDQKILYVDCELFDKQFQLRYLNPKQYFEEHPSLNQNWRTPLTGCNHSSARQRNAHSRQQSQQQIKQKPLCTIPRILLEKSVRKDIPSTFVTFLRTIFPEETVTSLIARYNLGVTRSRDVIYFQVDVKGNIRTGKIMKYNPATGKRVKDPGTPFKINWVHSVMKYAGQLPENWELTKCLFGEHLLSAIDEKQKTVALVESEKTAIIASGIMPKYIWLATGGKSQLKPEKLSVLKDRKVIAFPDVDGYQEWKEKLSKIEGLTITVSDVLEKNATDKERLNHIDIADWLIKWRQECIRQFGGTDAVPFAGHNHSTWDKADINPENCPTFANPNMQLVAKYFPSEHWPELEELIDDLDLIPTKLRIADPI